MTAVRTRATVAVVLLVAAACRRAPTGTTVLLPVVRVVDLVRGSPAMDRGVDLVLGRETRRTLALPASTVALIALDAGGRQYEVTTLPDVARRWRHVRLVRKATVRGANVDVPPVVRDLDDGTPTLPLVASETPQPRIAITVEADPRAGAIALETRPFTVPDAAELRFDVGIHAPGMRADLPVGAGVTVLDGRARRRVWRATLAGSNAAWHAERVSLARFAGRTIRLRFVSHAGAASAAYAMMAAFGEPVVLAPQPRAVRPFDVVLVSIDTLRARSVAAYGADRPTSPTIDAFAADGALFEQAFSPAAFTLPGHMSMLTGLWFASHRTMTATSILSPTHRTLAEALQSAGWATAAFTSGAWIMPWTGFRRGFDAYFEQAPSAYGADQPGGTPYEAFTHGLEWLRANADRPCFLFLHNYVVHAPYTPPLLYKRAFAPLPSGAPDEEQRRLGYEEEVRYADDQVRALLEALDALGRRDRTLVVVTADHGEQFFEHGGFEHTYDVHDEVAHVPLVMRLPGAIAAGREIAEPVSLADVAPTIVDVLGLPPIPDADGTSLLATIAGASDRVARDGVFTEAESEPSLGWTDLTAVRTRTTSCIHDARRDGVECFDRRIDPWERRPLPPDDSSETRAATAAIARFRTTHPPPDVTPTTADTESFTPSPAVTDERRRQLRDLGYVDE
jgi:arylsulfatase A-like enzyme